MNWLLLVSITLVVLTEHLSADRVFLWNVKSYYCGDNITDIMHTVCIHKKGDYVRTERSIQEKIKTMIGIASACCPLHGFRSGYPEIDGCTVREMLENYCDHPERFPIIGDYVVIKDWTSLERRRPVIKHTTPANISTTDEHASTTKYIQLPTN